MPPKVQVKNPRTNYLIHVGGRVWNSLTEQEQKKALGAVRRKIRSSRKKQSTGKGGRESKSSRSGSTSRSSGVGSSKSGSRSKKGNSSSRSNKGNGNGGGRGRNWRKKANAILVNPETGRDIKENGATHLELKVRGLTAPPKSIRLRDRLTTEEREKLHKQCGDDAFLDGPNRKYAVVTDTSTCAIDCGAVATSIHIAQLAARQSEDTPLRRHHERMEKKARTMSRKCAKNGGVYRGGE